AVGLPPRRADLDADAAFDLAEDLELERERAHPDADLEGDREQIELRLDVDVAEDAVVLPLLPVPLGAEAALHHLDVEVDVPADLGRVALDELHEIQAVLDELEDRARELHRVELEGFAVALEHDGLSEAVAAGAGLLGRPLRRALRRGALLGLGAALDAEAGRLPALLGDLEGL